MGGAEEGPLVYTGPPGDVPFTAVIVEAAASIHEAVAQIAEWLELEPSQTTTASALALARLCSTTRLGTVGPKHFAEMCAIVLDTEFKRLSEKALD